MHTGSELVETWIPVGGFKIERRRVRTQDAARPSPSVWSRSGISANWTPTSPVHGNPASTVWLRIACRSANRFSLWPGSTVSSPCRSPQTPVPGKPVPSSALPPEPVDVWRREIRELKAVGDLWDRIAAGDRRGEEMLERRLATGLARAPFHLAAVRENGSGFRMRYRPATLRAALWQRFAGEVAGLILCTRCSAPRCGRWFLKGDASRIDKQFCSAACRIRAFRQQGVGVSGGS